MSIPVIAISGSVGVGKTSVLGELNYILSEASVPHGCVERDALSYSWPIIGRFNEVMTESNLKCVVNNFLAAGAERLLIAGVIESDSDVEMYRRSIPEAYIQVCRLTADLRIRKERLTSRENGAGLEWHINRTEELDIIQDRARIESYTVDNGLRPLRQVALEVLEKGGWIKTPAGA